MPLPATDGSTDGNGGNTAACWHAQLSLMSDYLTDKQRCMLRGYYLATMQAALELVMTDDFVAIGPTVNKTLDEISAGSFSESASMADISGMESPSSGSVSSVGSGSTGGSGGAGR